MKQLAIEDEVASGARKASVRSLDGTLRGLDAEYGRWPLND
jgi:hypothetical protein|tara:strand:+ start:1017 stop:1139 length:123 start_codon:yes stop_codon:yes gene_type:complete